MQGPRLRDERGEITILIGIVLLAIAAFFGGYKLIGAAADWAASKVPDELESDIFGSFGDNQTGWRKDASGEGADRARAAFAKLRTTKDLRALNYRLYFASDSTPNAFAVPGGAISVTDGLLELVQGDIGLAMVLAHEFGHQQHRHSLKMMGRSLLLAGVVMMVVGDAGALLSLVVDLAKRSHSREQELEADEFGLQMVHRAFGTTEGAFEFFTKMEKAGPDQKWLTMLSTHPYTPDRLERLRRLQQQIDPAAAALLEK